MPKIDIFDTTLRDGEQSPGASMTLQEKLEIADDLNKLNVDIVEAGFPAASEDDLEAVRQIAKKLPDTEVAGLARVYKLKDNSFPDIDAVYSALKDANKPRLHVFIGTSPQHRKAKFKGMSLDGVIDLAVEGIKYGIKKFKDQSKKIIIEFSPEDAARTSKEDLIKVVKAVTEAGANVVNIPDTVGYAMPSEFAAHVRSIYDSVDAFKEGKAKISVHCHNDLGCSTANALESVMKGNARQIECSLIGLGERGGMTSLEQVAMAMKTRRDIFGEDAVSHINTEYLFQACNKVAKIIEAEVTRNPVIGENAFSHEAGIHQHGEIAGGKKEIRQVYEIMDPREVGWKGNKYVLGKHSGWHAVAYKLVLLGYDEVTETEAKEIIKEIKKIADKKKYVYNHEIDDIMISREKTPEIKKYEIKDWRASSGKEVQPQVSLLMTGENVEEEYVVGRGNGLVDAMIQAISNATKTHKDLVDFKVKSIAVGSNSPGKVTIYIKDNNGKEINHMGVAIDNDVVLASAKAYVNALNRMRMYHALQD